MRHLCYSDNVVATSPRVKGIQDSLGFWIPRRGFRIPGTGFDSSLCQWKLDSGMFQSLQEGLNGVVAFTVNG